MSPHDPVTHGMPWLTAQPEPHTQLRQEQDRRAAAKLSRDELSILADKLIVDWYAHSTLIDGLLRRVRCLEVEVEVALSKVQDSPTSSEIKPSALVRELLRISRNTET